MDKIKFEKAVCLIAYGLQQKLYQRDRNESPYGLALRHGLSIIAYEASEFMKGDELKDFLALLSEATFIKNLSTKSVREWFVTWPESEIINVQTSALWETGALVTMSIGNDYFLTEECQDIINGCEPWGILEGIDEHSVYKDLINLNQDNYVKLRKFLIQHPLLSIREKQQILLDLHNIYEEVSMIIDKAYEEIPDEVEKCPVCGWTMYFVGKQRHCCSSECEQSIVDGEKIKDKNLRLKKGIMRYFSKPGTLELDIEDRCNRYEKQGGEIKCYLWPEKDRYDLKVEINNKVYGVDAKTYSNPYHLAKSIANDCKFQTAQIDRGYYVIPEKIVKQKPGYLEICNNALKGQSIKDKFECITEKQFFKILREELNVKQ